jgi:hypothetical protein
MAEWRIRAFAPKLDEVIGEQRTVRDFLQGETIIRGSLEVEVRESLPTTDPRSGRLVAVPPVTILWAEERPLAVRLRSVVAISAFPSVSRAATLVESEATAHGLAVEQVGEAALWRMFASPPRPRLAHLH